MRWAFLKYFGSSLSKNVYPQDDTNKRAGKELIIFEAMENVWSVKEGVKWALKARKMLPVVIYRIEASVEKNWLSREESVFRIIAEWETMRLCA